MGIAKSKLIEIEERGYGESDKNVCSGCIKDPYLVKIIRDNGEVGACSYCKDSNGKAIKHRKVYSLEKLMADIVPAIRYYYMNADGNVPHVDGGYLGRVLDHYDFIHEVLAEEMQIESNDLLMDLYDVIEQINRISVFEFTDRTFKKDLRAWAKYTDLVNARNEMSVEQIVSLCVNEDAPDDLKEIHAVLKGVLNHAREMYSYSIVSSEMPLYRCVNFHPRDYKPLGYSEIPATLIGTAPAKAAANGRFNEKGDMMFYGASNPETAMKEVGVNEGFPFTIGEFYTNKRIRVLNLSSVASWKRPSFFSIDQSDIERRESWLFLREYINQITTPVDDRTEAKKCYKPIQVFTKYMQRVSGLHGIVYRSTKADAYYMDKDYAYDKCYVLFAENRDCMSEAESKYKYKANRLQLFMKKSWQVEPSDIIDD